MILRTSDSLYCMESSGQNKGLWMFFCHWWPELPWNANSCHVQKEKSWGPPNVPPPFTENETLEGAIKERCLLLVLVPPLPLCLADRLQPKIDQFLTKRPQYRTLIQSSTIIIDNLPHWFDTFTNSLQLLTWELLALKLINNWNHCHRLAKTASSLYWTQYLHYSTYCPTIDLISLCFSLGLFSFSTK